MNLNRKSDCIDPASENWPAMDDPTVWHAAKAKVPQAVIELARRERLNVPPIATAHD